jgi:hypothetical protein
VLDAAQESLAHYTDIKYEWEVAGKRGKGGKINAVKFYISKNNDYLRQITLNTYLTEQEQLIYEDEPMAFERPEEDNIQDPYEARIQFLRGACHDEFTYEEIVILNDKMRNYMSSKHFLDQLYCFHYIGDRYNDMNMQSKKRAIKNRFGYIKSLMDKEV